MRLTKRQLKRIIREEAVSLGGRRRRRRGRLSEVTRSSHSILTEADSLLHAALSALQHLPGEEAENAYEWVHSARELIRIARLDSG